MKLDTCEEIGALDQVTGLKKIHELKVYKTPTQNYVELNVTIDARNGSGGCNMLRRNLFTDVALNNTCPNKVVKSCQILNPESFGPECNVHCPCKSYPCTVKVLQRNAKNVNNAIRVCEIE